jgi:GTP:adenosylcobinamide-phosphate guanylyltransferase
MSADESRPDVGAVVMAGGAGTRLGTLGRSTPKCLLPLVDGQTLLSRLLLQLNAAGIRRIAVCCSPVNYPLICAALEAYRIMTGHSRDELKAVACTSCSLGPIPAMAEALERVSGRWRLLCLGDIHLAGGTVRRVHARKRSVVRWLFVDWHRPKGRIGISRRNLCRIARAVGWLPSNQVHRCFNIAAELDRFVLFSRGTSGGSPRTRAEYRHAPVEDWIHGSIERGAICTWMEAGNFVNVNSAEDYEFLTRMAQDGS